MQHRVEIAHVCQVGQFNINCPVFVRLSIGVMAFVEVIGLPALQHRAVDCRVRNIEPCENIRILGLQGRKVNLCIPGALPGKATGLYFRCRFGRQVCFLCLRCAVTLLRPAACQHCCCRKERRPSSYGILSLSAVIALFHKIYPISSQTWHPRRHKILQTSRP